VIYAGYKSLAGESFGIAAGAVLNADSLQKVMEKRKNEFAKLTHL
jgi:hypothetical protein